MLAEHVEGVRSGDDGESIHGVRVASRRLRAVLAMFADCWKPKQIKFWKQQICRLARDLGEARDRDVQIDFLVAKLAAVSDGTIVPGIARLLSHAEQHRQLCQPRVLQAVERFDHRGIVKQMLSAARRTLGEVEDASTAPSAVARRRAAKDIRKRLKRVLAEAAGLASAEQRDRHHAMRIAAKRLRYALELIRPPQPSEIDGILDSVKRVQTLLGEIHDCDVWVETLATFARTEAAQISAFFGDSRRFDRLRPGLDCLCEDRKRRRAELFGELAAYWQELGEKRLWMQLTKLLETDTEDNAAAGSTGAVAVTSSA